MRFTDTVLTEKYRKINLRHIGINNYEHNNMGLTNLLAALLDIDKIKISLVVSLLAHMSFGSIDPV